MLSRFITKGTISSLIAVISFYLGTSGHSGLAAFLNDPNTVQNILVLLGTASTLYAGAAQGLPPKAPPLPTAPATEADPYPGWDYDPLRGWVKIGDN